MAAYHAVMCWCIAVLIKTATAAAAAAATTTTTTTTYRFTTPTARLRTACTMALERSKAAGSSEIALEANCTGETLFIALGTGVVMPRQFPGVKVVDHDACNDYLPWDCAVTLCAGTSAKLHSSSVMHGATNVDLWLNCNATDDTNFGCFCGHNITVALYGMKWSADFQYQLVFSSSNITLVNSNITGSTLLYTCNATVVNSNISGDLGLSTSSSNLSVVDSNISALSAHNASIVTMVGNSVSNGVAVEQCNVTMVNNSLSGDVYMAGVAVWTHHSCNAILDNNVVSSGIAVDRCNATVLNGNVSGDLFLRECNATVVKTTVGSILFGFTPTSLALAALINLTACTVGEASANLKATKRVYSMGRWNWNLKYGDWIYYMNSLCENPEPRACFTLPQRIALICAEVNGKYTSYHSSPDTCIDSRWLVNVVLVYVLFGVAVMSILACAVFLRKILGPHLIPQTGRSNGNCAYTNFMRAVVKGIGGRASSKVHPLVAHFVQMLVPVLRIALMVWDIVTDAVVMYKLFEWSGGVGEWINSRLSSQKVGASDAVVGSYVVLYFVPYILSSLILHIRVAALVAGLRDAVILAYPSLLPYILHATLNPWLWIFLWWLYLFFPWLLWSLVMDIPMMALHTVSAGQWFAWLQLTNYFNLHSFLAAVIRAPYSAGLVTYVYVTGISAEQPIEVSSTLFWFGVGSSLLHILYWVGRFVLTAIAGWPDTSVHTLMKDMFVNLVKHDKVPTFAASMPA